jgi:CRP/FNR family transcriptional regulator, anaerobic regulatory protein
MRVPRVSKIQTLRGLKTFSWLTKHQLTRLAEALTMIRVKKHGIIFDENPSSEFAYVLVTGVARITCRNRKGDRTPVLMLAPGLIPALPATVSGIIYHFRCEAVSHCQIGTVALTTLIEIALGIAAADFKGMAASYWGPWNLVQLRSSNSMRFTLEERVALILLELIEDFGVPHKEGVRLAVSVRQKDMAELLGASRPRVNECLAALERKHLIFREGRLSVVRRDRLENFLAQRNSL